MMNFKPMRYYPVDQDLEDHRDLFYESEDTDVKNRIDLREWATPVENQASLRSCTSQAVVGAYEMMLKKQYPKEFTDLSALFVYYNTRVLEGIKTTFDPGVYIKDALRAVKLQGICAESVWPYNIKSFSNVPSLESYEDAQKRKIKNYYRCRNIDQTKQALSNSIPVIVSMKVYSNFQQLGWTGTSVLEPPNRYDMLIGGHSIVLMGYDDRAELFIARNSFGRLWGDNGYFYIPYAYAKDNFMDAWVFDIDVKLEHPEPEDTTTEILVDDIDPAVE